MKMSSFFVKITRITKFNGATKRRILLIFV